MNELATTAQATKFENKELQNVTKNILKAGESMTKNAFSIALNLAKVERENLFLDDGFETAQEYTEKTFGFKKTSYYNFLSIATYVDEKTCKAVLPKATTEWSVSQITALLPLGDVAIAEEMIVGEEINSDMTVREIKEAVKKHNKSEEESEPEETAPEEVEADVEIHEATYSMSLTEYDDGTVSVIVNGENVTGLIEAEAFFNVLFNKYVCAQEQTKNND